VIAGFVAFPVTADHFRKLKAARQLLEVAQPIADRATRRQTLRLGAGTTAGVALQALSLLPWLRGLGRYRLTFSVRHPSTRKLARLSLFVAGYVVANQIGYLIVQWLANKDQGGYSAYFNAYTFFLFPIGLFVLSVTTALMPAMSGDAVHKRWEAFTARFSTGVRATLLLVLPSAVGYLVLGRPIVRLLLENGVMTSVSTDLVSEVLAFLVLGLVQFAMFQLMFAIITPALIAGAFAERMKFSGFLLFTALWSLIVYSPVAHWVWGGGFIGDGIGALDFAGGTVVHINAGMAALAAAMVLGKRKGWPQEAVPPHNVPYVVLGASILWFGWFGFNAGSALAADGLAGTAFMNTQVATAAAIFGWLVVEWWRQQKPTAGGAATGAVAGLVAITPAAGFVRPWSSLVIGFVAGALCYFAVGLKRRFGYDDSLDVVGVHFVGGRVGAVLVGVYATDGSGLVYTGDFTQLWRQIIAVGITIVWAFVLSYVLLKFVDSTVGLRVSEEDEEQGLDLSEHGETAYSMDR
jgi:ammonium transporter, Amt family